LRWLRRTDRRLFEKVARWVSPAEWIFEELFGASGSSHSMASATGLYDYEQRSGTAPCAKPARSISKSSARWLAFRCEATHRSRGWVRLWFFSAIGDGAAGNLGSGADGGGRIAINVGTSAAVRMMEDGRTEIRNNAVRFVSLRGRRPAHGRRRRREQCRKPARLVVHASCGSKELKKRMDRKIAAIDALTVLPFWVGERARPGRRIFLEQSSA